MHSLRFHRTGQALEVLQLEEAGLPELEENEVRLRLLASPLNPADLNFIEGTYGVKPELPATPGIEGCGEVIESRSPYYAPGDRCIFLRRAKLWASEVQVYAGDLFKLPAGIDPQQAAMLKVNPATAWRLLTAFTQLPQGSWIIQNAANSGVGRSVIQLAKCFGVRTINLVRRTELIPQLVMLGADHVLLDDDSAVESIAAICERIPPILAFNAVGGDSALRLMNGLAPGGTHITYGAMARRALKVPNGMLIFKDLQIRGFWLSRWLDSAPRPEIDHVYARLAEEMLGKRLHIPVDSTYPLEDFPAAIKRLDQAERSGKVLFVP